MKTSTIFATSALMSLAAAGCVSPTVPESLNKSSSSCTLFSYCGTGIDIPSISVSGAVTDSTSKPVKGVKVTLVKGGSKSEDHTDYDGSYQVVSSPCDIADDWWVYFELEDIKREMVIIGPQCQHHVLNINNWPTG
jgi:hypothetical protein